MTTSRASTAALAIAIAIAIAITGCASRTVATVMVPHVHRGPSFEHRGTTLLLLHPSCGRDRDVANLFGATEIPQDTRLADMPPPSTGSCPPMPPAGELERTVHDALVAKGYEVIDADDARRDPRGGATSPMLSEDSGAFWPSVNTSHDDLLGGLGIDGVARIDVIANRDHGLDETMVTILVTGDRDHQVAWYAKCASQGTDRARWNVHDPDHRSFGVTAAAECAIRQFPSTTSVTAPAQAGPTPTPHAPLSTTLDREPDAVAPKTTEPSQSPQMALDILTAAIDDAHLVMTDNTPLLERTKACTLHQHPNFLTGSCKTLQRICLRSLLAADDKATRDACKELWLDSPKQLPEGPHLGPTQIAQLHQGCVEDAYQCEALRGVCKVFSGWTEELVALCNTLPPAPAADAHVPSSGVTLDAGVSAISHAGASLGSEIGLHVDHSWYVGSTPPSSVSLELLGQARLGRYTSLGTYGDLQAGLGAWYVFQSLHLGAVIGGGGDAPGLPEAKFAPYAFGGTGFMFGDRNGRVSFVAGEYTRRDVVDGELRVTGRMDFTKYAFGVELQRFTADRVEVAKSVSVTVGRKM